jgi:hypothetical protein
VDAQTLGPLTELARQIAQNNAQTAGAEKLTSGYFNALEPFAAQGAQNARNIAQGLNQTLAGIGSDTQSRLQGIGNDQVNNLIRYTPGGQTGLNAAATGSLLGDIAKQQGFAAQNAQTFRDFGASEGANQAQLANSNLGSFALRGQETLGQIARAGQLRNEPLSSKVAALRAQRGSLLATEIGKLRQQEIANQITRTGLGIKQETAQSTAANNATRNALTARGQNITAAHNSALERIAAINAQIAQGRLTESQRHNLVMEANAQRRAAAKGGITPTENTKYLRQIAQVQSLIRQAQVQKDKTGKPLNFSEAQIRDFLTSGKNPVHTPFDPAIVDAAYALNGWGVLTQPQVDELHSLGITIGNRYKIGTPKPGSLQQIGQNFNNAVGRL